MPSLYSKFRNRGTADTLQQGLSEAEVAIEQSDAYEPSAAEEHVDTLEEHLKELSDNPEIKSFEEGLDPIREQIGNFVEKCEQVKKVMDKLAGVHPWLQVGVAIFKTALDLELTRRANNARVLALHVAMCEMMSTMKLLSTIEGVNERVVDGETAASRLRKRMGDKKSGIIGSIRTCSNLCDSYSKRNLAVKIITSAKWEDRFIKVANIFEGHKSGIKDDLQIYTAITISTVAEDVAAMKQMVQLAFRQLLSPEEREIKKYIHTYGGIEGVMKDNARMERMLEMSRSVEDDRTDKDAGQMTVTEFQAELLKDIQVVLEENAKALDNKFQLMLAELGKIEGVVQRESNRTVEEIIKAMRDGPHGRIVDCDVFHVWTQNGWKASVKARYLVIALHDYFSELANATDSDPSTAHVHAHVNDNGSSGSLPEESTLVSAASTTRVHHSMSTSIAQDAWALQFINVFRVQQLIEAIDDDISSFVTVTEINRFTNARPNDWTLPRWIAYSTIGKANIFLGEKTILMHSLGVELSVHWYYRRIIRLFNKIGRLVQTVLPVNRVVVNNFMESRGLHFIDKLLCGLHEPAKMDDIDWDHDVLFGRFREYANDREEDMKRMIGAVAYHLDDQTTLRIVTRGGQPEKYIMPLVCLMLRRALYVINCATHNVIHKAELEVLDTSILTMRRAVWERVDKLEAMYKFQRLDASQQRANFFYGIFSYIKKATPASVAYWSHPDCEQHLPEDDQMDTGHDFQEDGPVDTALPVTTTSTPKPRETLSGKEGSPSADGIQDTVHQEEAEHDQPQAVFNGNAVVRGLLDAPAAVPPTPPVPSSSGDNTRQNGDVPMAMSPTETCALLYPEEQDTLTIYDIIRVAYADQDRSSSSLLPGRWWGTRTPNSQSLNATSFGFDVDLIGPGGHFTTFIDVDERGTFDMEGVVRGQNVDLHQIIQAGSRRSLRYEGTLNDTGDEIKGTWSSTKSKGGTFIFRRVSADFHIYRPSKEEFDDNPARARWSWAIKTIIHRWRAEHLQTEFVRHRRKCREKYLELAYLRELGQGLRSNDAQDWRHILRIVDQRDILSWETRRVYSERSKLTHQTIHCDGPGCKNVPITGGRYMCVECSVDWINESVDFCFSCVNAGASRSKYNAEHGAHHHFLQLRTVIHRQRLHALHQTAKAIVGRPVLQNVTAGNTTTSETDGNGTSYWPSQVPCVDCGRVLGSEFWACLECTVPTIVCPPCNAEVERRQPWLFEPKPHGQEDPHNWTHALVLIRAPQGPSDDHELHTTDGSAPLRTMTVDERLDKLERSIARIESLLHRLMGGKIWN